MIVLISAFKTLVIQKGRDVVCEYADLFLVCMFLDIPDPDEQTNK